MAASYPSAVKSFSTKVDGIGQTIAAAHINALQDEVAALETDLVNGLPVARGGTDLAAGTSGGILGFTGTTTLASSALLTNHGVVLGQGAGATPVATSAGTTGQVLAGVTGADPTFQSLSALVALSLLKASSGTDTNAAATTVDSIATGALTVKDRLEIMVDVTAIVAAMAGLQLYSVTDGVSLGTFTSGALAIGETVKYRLDLGVGQASATAYHLLTNGRGTTLGAQGTLIITTGLTAWTTGFTLGLRHTGVTATGTCQWSWSVHLVRGQ